MFKQLTTTLSGTAIALAFLPGAVGIGNAATPTQPFNQCPAIGADTSCGLLLVINPDGTVTAVDGGQPPYDNIEDTLIGVQNNSAVSVPSLTLNGPGAFGFDGDGICSGQFAGTPVGCPRPNARWTWADSGPSPALPARPGGQAEPESTDPLVRPLRPTSSGFIRSGPACG